MYGAIVLHRSDIESHKPYELDRITTEIRIAMKRLTGYEYDNQHLFYISNTGKHYAILIHTQQPALNSIAWKRYAALNEEFKHHNHIVIQVHLWDQRGITSIANFDIFCNVMDNYPKGLCNQLDKAIAEYESGKIHCSDCKTLINQNEVAGRYFAGSYCNMCWVGLTGTHKEKGGWKKVEAQETYN